MTMVAAAPFASTSALALALTDVSLTVMLVGAIALAGATVIITTMPNVRLPRWFRRKPSAPRPAVQQPVAQRRVVTGRAPSLQPTTPQRVVATPVARQSPALTDGRRPTSIDVTIAEAVIDRFLDADPELLAKTISALIATDDRGRRTAT